MEKSDLDRLLQRYLTGQVSVEEKIKIEAWLNILKTEDKANLELTREDEDVLFQKITAGNAVPVEFPRGRERRLQPGTWILRIAASLLFLAVVSYFGWYLIGKYSDSREPFSVQAVEKMILNDGTLVWLRGKSKLTYYEKKDEGIRYAEFTGEALFEVAKDPIHPFVIQCGDVKIKVLGTSFNIKTANGGLELKVLTGKVNVTAGTGHAALDVEPNEKFIYSHSGVEKLSLDRNEISVITADTEYMMRFSNTTLNEVMQGIGKKFDVDFALENDQTGNCRITADFTDHSLESSLQIITEMLDVGFSRDGKKITINGKGCH